MRMTVGNVLDPVHGVHAEGGCDAKATDAGNPKKMLFQ